MWVVWFKASMHGLIVASIDNMCGKHTAPQFIMSPQATGVRKGLAAMPFDMP
jgi:hypothetical protein